MDLLVLGGTVFVGRHFVEAALARGHRITIFHRGSKGTGLIPGVEEVLGDRDGGLANLPDRKWDAVVDTCGYVPRVVRQSVEALRDKVDRYLFVSTISVYAEGQERLDEGSPTQTLEDPEVEEITGETYGGLKVLCERAVDEVYGDRALIVRPGLIMGPFDPTNRFTYWVTRFADGGRVLLPNRPSQPSQLIDARDLANFMVLALEQGRYGVFNACGPDTEKTFADLVGACHRLNLGAEPVWVDPAWLVENGVELWQELPLVLPPDGSSDAMQRVDNSRAIEAGLRFRSWEETAADTLAWRRAEPVAGPLRFGLDREKEAEVLEKLAASS